MKIIGFDIETLAKPAEEIKQFMPQFDEADVKLGNLKDEEKIRAKVEEAKKKHEEKFFENAALSAQTARVAIIGTCNGIEALEDESDDAERLLLCNWWSLVNKTLVGSANGFVGYYIKQFDLPFLVRRSWILGVRIPPFVWGWKKRGFAEEFIDLHEIWNCASYKNTESTGGLDGLCKLLGVKGKSGNGSEFAALWAKDKKAAIEYCRDDVRCVIDCAKQMGVAEMYHKEAERREY